MAIIQYLNILEKTANINIKPKQEVKETVFKYTKHKDKEVAEKAEAVIKQIEKWQEIEKARGSASLPNKSVPVAK